MKRLGWLVLLPIIILSACQPVSPRVITIIDGDNVINIKSKEEVPLLLFTEAGISIQPDDRVFVNGFAASLDSPISEDGHIQLELRRAVTITLVTAQGQQTLQTSAPRVGDALSELGYPLSVNDDISPPAKTPIRDSMTITFQPARELKIRIGENVIGIHSNAGTVGEALAKAGIPLVGLDTSFPAENEALPPDGQIAVTRVYESIDVDIESIPYSVEEINSLDLAFGEEKIIQPGTPGLTMVRTRIRYENGKEVSRENEGETILREPVKQIVASGSKIVLNPAGGGIPYSYWHAAEMYASWYSPCNSGTGGCSYGTASGARAGYGIVAVDYSIYSYLAGMRVYIPGYGVATIGDTGGGPIIETAFGVQRTQWIDLGYDDNNIGGLSGWVTVYFLEPAPAEIPYFLK